MQMHWFINFQYWPNLPTNQYILIFCDSVPNCCIYLKNESVDFMCHSVHMSPNLGTKVTKFSVPHQLTTCQFTLELSYFHVSSMIVLLLAFELSQLNIRFCTLEEIASGNSSSPAYHVPGREYNLYILMCQLKQKFLHVEFQFPTQNDRVSLIASDICNWLVTTGILFNPQIHEQVLEMTGNFLNDKLLYGWLGFGLRQN